MRLIRRHSSRNLTKLLRREICIPWNALGIFTSPDRVRGLSGRISPSTLQGHTEMKLQAPGPPSAPPSTRRDFLKKTGTASAALVSTLSVGNAFPSEQTNEAPGTQTCNYSLLSDNFVYLNSGTEGSMPNCVIENFRAGLQKWAGNPTTSYETDPVFGKRQQLHREIVGEFFGVGTDNICPRVTQPRAWKPRWASGSRKNSAKKRRQP